MTVARTRFRRLARAATVLALIADGGAALAASAERPFSDQSPWNARPTKVTLGTYEIPRSKYFPSIASGSYSLAVAVAGANDPPVVVKPQDGKPGVWDPDGETMLPQVTIPHWPAGVTPATGSDGHADIVDVAANRIHSFYYLRNVGGEWRSAQYAWTALDGRGWGDPGHYFQGSRATGVPAMAGLIRKGEVDDGQPTYRHALAMSLTFNALSRDPTYVFPATSADSGAENTNSGSIPEGALMMLPPTFDVASIRNPKLAKVVRTLMTYGAYVVDRNDGTPFVVYVENGADFDLHKGGWNNDVAGDLDRMRAALRQVVAVGGWLDAQGKPFAMSHAVNLLSLRGPWQSVNGGPVGRYDSTEQAILFPPDAKSVVQTNVTNRTMQPVPWSTPKGGASVRLAVTGSAGATLKLDLVDTASGSVVASSGDVEAGHDRAIRWPAVPVRPVVTVSSGPTAGGRVAATLVETDRR